MCSYVASISSYFTISLNDVRGILFLKPLLPQNLAFYSNLEETVFSRIREREKDSTENVHRIHLELKLELQFNVSPNLHNDDYKLLLCAIFSENQQPRQLKQFRHY